MNARLKLPLFQDKSLLSVMVHPVAYNSSCSDRETGDPTAETETLAGFREFIWMQALYNHVQHDASACNYYWTLVIDQIKRKRVFLMRNKNRLNQSRIIIIKIQESEGWKRGALILKVALVGPQLLAPLTLEDRVDKSSIPFPQFIFSAF